MQSRLAIFKFAGDQMQSCLTIFKVAGDQMQSCLAIFKVAGDQAHLQKKRHQKTVQYLFGGDCILIKRLLRQVLRLFFRKLLLF